MDLKCSYALELSCPNRQRLEVSKNVKYIAVTLRTSKLQVFKVRQLWDLNPCLPLESSENHLRLKWEAWVQIPQLPKWVPHFQESTGSIQGVKKKTLTSQVLQWRTKLTTVSIQEYLKSITAHTLPTTIMWPRLISRFSN